MPVCASVNWLMFLLKQGATTTENFTFDDVDIDSSGNITGTVVDINGNRTPLTGTCINRFSTPEISDLTFHFHVKGSSGSPVQVFMPGVGIQNAPKATFVGGYVAFEPVVQPPATLVLLAVDPGETGTGTGNQT